MDNDIDNKITGSRHRGRTMAGAILLVVGAVLLVHQFDFFWFPDWLFSWPMWIIAWALYIGAKHQFRSASWVFLLLVGVVFLLDDNVPAFNAHDILWPLLIICFGVWLIVRRSSHKPGKQKYYDWSDKSWKDKYANQWQTPNEPVVDYTVPPTSDTPPASSTSSTDSNSYRPAADDYLDAVSVFGGVKKTILSKNFKGGEVVNVFGGAELDFSQANINGHVVIDITQIFGGTKIVVPANWRVVPDLSAVFASVDDKRIRTSTNADSDKVLILKGVSVFAGVDIRSY